MNSPGDSLSPDELVEHAAFLRALARSLVADPTQAEDLVQEATPRRGSSWT